MANRKGNHRRFEKGDVVGCSPSCEDHHKFSGTKIVKGWQREKETSTSIPRRIVYEVGNQLYYARELTLQGGVHPVPKVECYPHSIGEPGSFGEAKMTIPLTKSGIALLLRLQRGNTIEKVIKLLEQHWRFDDRQQHIHTWHDKQDCLEKIRKLIEDE